MINLMFISSCLLHFYAYLIAVYVDMHRIV